jgi:hypothetical protein
MGADERSREELRAEILACMDRATPQDMGPVLEPEPSTLCGN